jgi:dCTP diphosphatase
VRKPVGPRLSTVDGETDRSCADTQPVSDIADLTRRMRHCTEARDWAQFHDPKSLTLALVGEVGELAELLQWVRHEDQATVVQEQPLHERLAEEMSDVLLYLL